MKTSGIRNDTAITAIPERTLTEPAVVQNAFRGSNYPTASTRITNAPIQADRENVISNAVAMSPNTK